MEVSSFSDLLDELQEKILQLLSGETTFIASSVCKQWNKIINKNWSLFCDNEFPSFKGSQAADTKMSEVLVEFTKMSEYVKNQINMYSRWRKLITTTPVPGPREQYRNLINSIDLNGTWLAVYGAHGLEVIRVTQTGYNVHGLKIKGDPNVPSGKTTFEVTLKHDLVSGIGRMHLASTGYINPHWGLATIDVHNENEFYIRWYATPYPWITKFWRCKEHIQSEKELTASKLSELLSTNPFTNDDGDDDD
eukprot:TRINITY_DN6926_c0_g1_i1.p1 TRINITY_DN6926_c0_g1~~TRINITY_DN6926_c0_g1_i1.p1  ORF type:complete len:249 (-),score=26.74 TRINITY_DN6926_c0_g1_i1:227-973(-)